MARERSKTVSSHVACPVPWTACFTRSGLDVVTLQDKEVKSKQATMDVRRHVGSLAKPAQVVRVLQRRAQRHESERGAAASSKHHEDTGKRKGTRSAYAVHAVQSTCTMTCTGHIDTGVYTYNPL